MSTPFYSRVELRYQPKNKLQSALQKAVKDLDGLIVMAPDAFHAYIGRLVERLNPEHPKCTPLKTDTWGTNTIGVKQASVTLDQSIVVFTFHPVKGNFLTHPLQHGHVQLWSDSREGGSHE
jgi:hypothetical protein